MDIFQKSPLKFGFTLIEIMVVIALIGIMAISAVSFNFNAKSELEKRDRLVESIIHLIDKAKTDAMLGRGIASGGTIVSPDNVELSLSPANLAIRYIGSSTVNGESLSSPFYGESGYAIKSITGSWSDGTAWVAPSTIIFRWSTIDFDTAASGSVFLNIKTGYNTSTKIITFDRRTGKIDIK